MRRIFLGTMLLVASLAGVATADDQSDARAILDEAIKAHGGEEALQKPIGLYFKEKGSLFDLSLEWLIQGDAKQRMVCSGDSPGIDIINGKEGWTKSGDQPTEKLTEAQVESRREDTHLIWATGLVSFTTKECRLSVLDETLVDGRKAVGIVVTQDKHKPLRLYFDKESHLLVKCQRKGIEAGSVFDDECVYSDYRTIQKTKHPFKIEMFLNGMKSSDALVSRVTIFDKPLDEKLFSKP